MAIEDNVENGLSNSDTSSNQRKDEENGIPGQQALNKKLSRTPAALSDPENPLNWPLPLKISALLIVSLLSALGGLNTAIINPAYVPLASSFSITPTVASYQTTLCIALNGIGPFLWVPLSNKYGRRPILLFTTFLGFASALGSAYARTYGELLVARVFNGLFPAAFSLGACVVTDVFALERRGRAMGVFTVLSVGGSHVAPLLGGPLGEYKGWRWCFLCAAVLNGGMVGVVLVGFGETLYIPKSARDGEREGEGGGAVEERGEGRKRGKGAKRAKYWKRLRLYSHNPSVKLRWNQFVWPSLRMGKYPSVLFPALYFGMQYGFASILPAVTVATIFSQNYGWTPLEIGLGYGAALTIGGSLGELAGGMVLDAIVEREIRKRNGEAPPLEVRLRAIWTGEVLVPAGLLIYGFTMQYRTHWMGPLFGMGLSSFAIQIIATTCYTYSTDCYRSQSNEVAQFINFVRQEFGMTFAFYAVSLCGRIGYHLTFVLFAILGSVLAFVPIVALMLRGEEWRKRLEEGDGREREEMPGKDGFVDRGDGKEGRQEHREDIAKI